MPKPELRVAADLEALDRLVAARNGCPAVPDDAPIPAQEPVRFLSEWQTFVIRGVIEGVSHCAGDPLIFPAGAVIRMCIAAFSNTRRISG